MSAVCLKCGAPLKEVEVYMNGKLDVFYEFCSCLKPKPDRSCGNCRWKDKPDGFAKCERCVVERNWEAKI